MSERSFESDAEISDQELDLLLRQGAMRPTAKEQDLFWQDLAGRLDRSETEADAPLSSLPPLLEPEEPVSPAQKRKLFALRPAALSVAAAVVALLIAFPVMRQASQPTAELDSAHAPSARTESEPMTLGAGAPPEEMLSKDMSGLADVKNKPQAPAMVESEVQLQQEAARSRSMQADPVAEAKENQTAKLKSHLPAQKKEAAPADEAAAAAAHKALVAQRWAELKKILADLPVTVKPLNDSQAELKVPESQAAAVESRLSAWSIPSAFTHKFFRDGDITYLLEISATP